MNTSLALRVSVLRRSSTVAVNVTSWWGRTRTFVDSLDLTSARLLAQIAQGLVCHRSAVMMTFLDLTLPTLAENLALDEALLVAAEERGTPGVLRLWEPAELAVVMGASCRRQDEVQVDACLADGIEVARRSSGGGTVLIGPGALNLALVLPLDAAPGLEAVEAAQRFVIERCAHSLQAVLPAVEVQGSGDLACGGRKCAGSAQRRLRRHFLVHVSLLYNFPLELVSRYLGAPARQPAYRQGRSHAEFLINLGLPRSRIIDQIRAAWLEGEPSVQDAPVPFDLVARLVAEKFADPAWVERF